MTHISNLPKEIIETIFSDFNCDLLECQKVCRGWYSPMHVLLLQRDIQLSGEADLYKFITSIDNNPDPAYLNTVTTIIFYNKDREEEEEEDYDDYDDSEEHTDSEEEDKDRVDYERLLYRLSKKELFQRLFFRFSNLKAVQFHGLFWVLQWLDDTLCKELLESCPKLDKFEVYYHPNEDPEDEEEIDGEEEYGRALRSARSLVTSFNIKKLDPSGWYSYDDVAGYVASFPRLKDIGHNHFYFKTFQEWCLVLEKHPTYPRVDIVGDDFDNFMEDHLASLSDVNREKLIRRLSKVRDLKLELDSLPLNAMATTCKYLTGLDTFVMNLYYGNYWNERQKHMFRSGALNLLPSVKKCGIIALQKMDFTFLSAIFDDIVCRMFDGLPEGRKTSNNLKLTVPCQRQDLILKYYNEKQFYRLIYIESNEGLRNVVSSLFNKQLDNVDTFELNLKHSYEAVTIDMYDKILSRMPSLRKVILDIPNWFENTQVHGRSGSTLSKVEDVELKANMNINFQALLNRFCSTLPNIRHLQICYSKDDRDREIGTFNIALLKYSLKQLTLDLTPVTAFKTLDDNYFLLICVKLSNGIQKFKVPLNLSSATRIRSKDLAGLTRDKDYCLVYITINCLTRLVLSVDYNKHRYQGGYRWDLQGKKTRLIRLDHSE